MEAPEEAGGAEAEAGEDPDESVDLGLLCIHHHRNGVVVAAETAVGIVVVAGVVVGGEADDVPVADDISVVANARCFRLYATLG